MPKNSYQSLAISSYYFCATNNLFEGIFLCFKLCNFPISGLGTTFCASNEGGGVGDRKIKQRTQNISVIKYQYLNLLLNLFKHNCLL